MVDREQTRQISCVVRQLKTLMEGKTKGSVVIHMDGSGFLGNQIEIHMYEWRDGRNYKLGCQIDEEAFFQLLMGNG
jgi:hypothetical protein